MWFYNTVISEIAYVLVPRGRQSHFVGAWIICQNTHFHLPNPVGSFLFDDIWAFAVAFIVKTVPPGLRHKVSELRCILWLSFDRDFGLIFSILWWNLLEWNFDSDLFKEYSVYKTTLALLL